MNHRRRLVAAVAALGDTLVELADQVLGLGLEEAVMAGTSLGARLRPMVDGMLEERANARTEKDFERADRIRDQLAAAGIVVEDRPGGSRWYVGDPPDRGTTRLTVEA